MKIGTYLQNALLGVSLTNTPYTPPTTVYAGLNTADPTDTTATAISNEVSGNAYARQAISWGTISLGSVSSSADVTFPQATPAGWGSVGYITIWDSLTGGNLLYHGALSSSVTINAQDQVKIIATNLTVQLT